MSDPQRHEVGPGDHRCAYRRELWDLMMAARDVATAVHQLRQRDVPKEIRDAVRSLNYLSLRAQDLFQHGQGEDQGGDTTTD